MPNPRTSRGFPGKFKPPKGKPPAEKGRDGTANWPGLPGPAQPKPRDTSGTRKLRQGPKEEGI